MTKYNVKKTKDYPKKPKVLSENQLYCHNLLKYTNSEIKKINEYLARLNKNKRIIKQLIGEIK